MSKRILTAGLVVLALAGCGGGGPLEDDPSGAEACEALADALRSEEDDTVGKLGGLFEAGEAAQNASTTAIRDATNEIAGQWTADTDVMHAACVKAGVEMPALP